MNPKWNLAALFDEQERLREIDPKWSEAELLSQPGLFSFAKVATALKLERKYLLDYLKRKAEIDGWDLEKEYGLFKSPRSHWRVNLQIFKKQLEPLRERFSVVDLKRVPQDIDRRAFFNLNGIYRMKDIMDAGYLPVTKIELVTYIEEKDLSRRECGAWKRGPEWLVDFVPFILFVAAYQKGITLEEAKKLAAG